MLRIGRNLEVLGRQETTKGEGLGFGVDKRGRRTGGGGGSGSRGASDVLDIELLAVEGSETAVNIRNRDTTIGPDRDMRELGGCVPSAYDVGAEHAVRVLLQATSQILE